MREVLPRLESAEAPASPLLVRCSFDDIAGWRDDDHAAALRAFHAGVDANDGPPKTRALGVSGADLRRAMVAAGPAVGLDGCAARRFFERWFVPHRVAAEGFITGYYEPEALASQVPTDLFAVPLYRRPPDLVEVANQHRPAGWDSAIRFARHTPTGLREFPDRRAIEAGALAGRGLELAWIADPVDAFFIHVQGSARLRLPDGSLLRISFDGKSGHPYTSIGRLAVERGLLSHEDATKQGLERWLKANRDAGRALMAENRSFIFFRETFLAAHHGPLGAAGAPLTAGRSIAVDRTLHSFHTPVWVEAGGLADPDRAGSVFRRLMIAQDTGSAIIGPARGDLFFGSGEAAGILAGQVRHAARMTVLMPQATAAPQ